VVQVDPLLLRQSQNAYRCHRFADRANIKDRCLGHGQTASLSHSIGPDPLDPSAANEGNARSWDVMEPHAIQDVHTLQSGIANLVARGQIVFYRMPIPFSRLSVEHLRKKKREATKKRCAFEHLNSPRELPANHEERLLHSLENRAPAAVDCSSVHVERRDGLRATARPALRPAATTLRPCHANTSCAAFL
jgi:hypothetical protein